VLRACGLVLLFATGCGERVDYVAGSPSIGPDAGPAPCLPGVYSGVFRSNQGLPLQGSIKVVLSLSPSGESFIVDRSSTLTTTDLSTGATVSAVVVGTGSCSTGGFSATIEEGKYGVPGDAGVVVDFHGRVSGAYRPTPRGPALAGTWATFVDALPTEEPISAGSWGAMRRATPDAGAEP
jgi:hypothetical protein